MRWWTWPRAALRRPSQAPSYLSRWVPLAATRTPTSKSFWAQAACLSGAWWSGPTHTNSKGDLAEALVKKLAAKIIANLVINTWRRSQVEPTICNLNLNQQQSKRKEVFVRRLMFIVQHWCIFIKRVWQIFSTNFTKINIMNVTGIFCVRNILLKNQADENPTLAYSRSLLCRIQHSTHRANENPGIKF